jgi:ribosomal-protein-alanine N-acetyltransferase
MRKAFPEDIERVMEIESGASARWKREFFERELETDFSIFLVAEENDSVIGFAVAWDVPGEIQLQNIAVDERYRRKGTATRLIEYLCRLLEQKLPEKILLELRASNVPAEKFYRSLGFNKTGIRKNYYGNSEDAILMEKKIIKDNLSSNEI